MEALVLVFLILLNGVFAMAEIAIVTARRGRLQAMTEQGDRAAGVALRLAEEPTQFLSTVQIGITSIGIMNGIVGEAVLAQPFANWLQEMGLGADAAGPVATTLVVVVVTYLTIVVGELVPKRIGQISAEQVSRMIAYPMSLLALIAIPLVKLLALSTQLLLRVLGFWQSQDVTFAYFSDWTSGTRSRRRGRSRYLPRAGDCAARVGRLHYRGCRAI